MAVKSAERVFRIFELLEQSPEGLTNKEVSSLLGFAPSSTLALLQTMEENGYLSADEQKRYYLGGRLMSLGAVAASRIDLNKIGTPYLKKLMQTVEETCFLGVLSGDEIVYIAKENCERTITTNASIGSRKPVYCTGLGKAFLAFLPEKESSQIIDRIEREALRRFRLLLVIHMDPVETHNELVVKFKDMVADVLENIDSRLEFHDFRMVDGQARINLIFDLVVPWEYKQSVQGKLKARISDEVKKRDGRCECVITVENSIMSGNKE